ncbi:3-hydroxybenzoate 4-monooxygenase [Sulfitobacter sp. M57]|uniref:FAD-dependent monooxygenase n=1 Tax=unclassified Sulfitobacter TaxID=196795 RepID=UPI0023E27B9D|nr:MULTISPECIES: FAD-dependent monooxygenase [unclassified Sulfitobacter]MDF3413020.1 3-hydroxybenzoate 4-monooxygenase [Sulfitobacter sp. KE5]MDF3421696.1 3-hydroxybenzoate 4-monooxygenase [Sulfitobacter sp. KE43]MDF3431569.1 3-hydroxybenzoate 4-monooxygenase [Sulfitobacter sp. KE42]MDF3457210.1 3-hydroxybenzoate 4-monooxygenase [Sulfitobacter sp. S74]MDF3461113.1 3-hydroxybenzoate 4-monooxygenase [Sulfitobacter sp. Ks18]
MQYHLNGFKPGNYQVPDAARKAYPNPPIKDLPTTVDVLIIGTGPAGLTMARQMSEFNDITTCIVDMADGPLLFGRADGISCRTIEIMEAFNSSEMVVKETYKLKQNTFWEPDPDNPVHIKRTEKIDDARAGLSEFTHGIVNQARLHELLSDGMANSITNLRPHCSRELLELVVNDSLTQDPSAHPITATFRRTDNAGKDKRETIKARFVVGCDGGRSRVRKSLGITLEGDSANKAWGVMDILLNTDFPDIRVKSFIQSKDHGAVMIIPREGGYLCRFYVEMDVIEKEKRASEVDITEQDLIAKAQQIFHPYTLDVKEVAWWSIYSVGQRIADRFDNRPADSSDEIIPRAFVAGDACHTHSPKGGWGLNTSLPDTFNLGWKMAAVLQGKSAPQLLATYATERRKVAQQLINADKELSKLVATRPASAAITDDARVDTAEIEAFMKRQSGFVSGTSIEYFPSYICAGQEHQRLASGFKIGQRFHSAVATRLTDGATQHLGHLVKADGRWRIFMFTGDGDPTQPSSAAYKFANYMEHDPASPVQKYTPAGADIDSVIDTYAVFQDKALSMHDLHSLHCPATSALTLDF